MQHVDEIDRFAFENDLVVHNDIGDVTSRQKNTVVLHWEQYLTPEWYTCLGEFVTEAGFVDRFEQAPDRGSDARASPVQ